MTESIRLKRMGIVPALRMLADALYDQETDRRADNNRSNILRAAANYIEGARMGEHANELRLGLECALEDTVDIIELLTGDGTTRDILGVYCIHCGALNSRCGTDCPTRKAEAVVLLGRSLLEEVREHDRPE